jgi:hypothetical protein
MIAALHIHQVSVCHMSFATLSKDSNAVATFCRALVLADVVADA